MKVFDGHADTISRCWKTDEGLFRNTGHLDLERMAPIGCWAQFFACFWDRDEAPDRLPYQIFLAQVEVFQRQMAKNADVILPCRDADEIRMAWEEGKQAALLSVEGAELLDCDIAKLEEAYRLGVRAVNLTWNHANALSGSNAEHPERGLTDRGRRFAERMLEMGMLIDVSHLSDPGFWDVCELAERAQKPFFASHSNSRAVFFHSRNLTDEQFTAIIKSGGVAGLNLYPAFLGEAPDVDTLVRHIERWFSLGGEKNVSLGGDWDGISQTPKGIVGIQDLHKLAERLLRLNYAEEQVNGLFWKNLMRVVREVCTM